MFREKMFDAEAAVTLLNNWTYPKLIDEFDRSLDVLREGNLDFTYERGFVGTPGISDITTCIAESLYFRDGSRALRVMSKHCASGWSQWTALHPLPQGELQ
ncbi:hypothetical protein PPMP20_28315 [Paraburkholderia phymatum]|uniref:Uncharacterized protein n=1 Tax=Paraburkholderia phymatum (strain DSM 17167 / CIP 108236 / LMG 21445 / STM815) TaxID=391038 RepID=B2JNA0_PARP8|nr:hypothetical protein [Paraburkholderia phymatum]ACC72948.1 hypothetical protein Bphy_3817 [Paraburkholderia phymatum STM815]